MYHTTPAHGIPCEQDNNAEPRANHQPDDTLAGEVGGAPLPAISLSVAMCVVADATAILSYYCLV